jgi:hypothetical protein
MSAIISSADATSLAVLDFGGAEEFDRDEGGVFWAGAPDSGALYLALGGRIGTESGITTFAIVLGGVAATVDLFSPFTETPSCLGAGGDSTPFGAGGDSVGASPPPVGLLSPFASTVAS